MDNIIAKSFANLIRWGVYLILIGEIASCTVELKQKAHRFVRTGLLSLKTLNKSLHSKTFKK